MKDPPFRQIGSDDLALPDLLRSTAPSESQPAPLRPLRDAHPCF